jgi:hypothetical protein
METAPRDGELRAFDRRRGYGSNRGKRLLPEKAERVAGLA